MLDQQNEQEMPLYVLNPRVHYLQLEEGLNEYLEQLSALTEFGLSDGLPDYPKLFIHNYLWVIHHHVARIKELTEAIFNVKNQIAIE